MKTNSHEYSPELARRIESDWQDRWDRDGTYNAPNVVGNLAGDLGGRAKFFVMDMFPYPSGAGLHVGHPLGFIATDVVARFRRMLGDNVLHALGFDAFGLPAEQFAVQTGRHPRDTTEENIANMRRQLRRLGLGHDQRRSFATIDPDFMKWTQWIFNQIFDSWYDKNQERARPISELIDELGTDDPELIDRHRLAYISESQVNWCPALGTVLANEEVTSNGRSERGNFPVFRRNLRQWHLRITAYADRLIEDLATVDWPEPVVLMQRNWIGRSVGVNVAFQTEAGPLTVFTSRPDTMFGVTYLAIAPDHPLVDRLTAAAWPAGADDRWTRGAANPVDAVTAYQRAAARTPELERQENREKTGVFTGLFATNPVNGGRIPVFVADYVLATYGTGAIMAVPAHDERDYEFAEAFGLPVRRVIEGGVLPWTGDGEIVNSSSDRLDFNGLASAEAKTKVLDWLVSTGHGARATTYRLRDWLFSRQRFWGEPFPIVYDENDRPIALPDSMLPVRLPDLPDYSPTTFEPDDIGSSPQPPLARLSDWVNVTLDLGDGPKRYRRETNTMPNWAGSSWYELRYTDPDNEVQLSDPRNEIYWMGSSPSNEAGGVDLYVGGAEHAVLHLLYVRFWHKVLFDLGYVSSSEPFRKLVNQGYIQAYAFTDGRGAYVPAAEVVEQDDGTFRFRDEPVEREFGKMGKSLKNVVTPDEICNAYGADTFRVHEMSMGPIELSRPWETRAVVGSQRFLQRVWRLVVDPETGRSQADDSDPDRNTLRVLHRTLDGVRADMMHMRFNTAVSKMIELTNNLTKWHVHSRSVLEPLVQMLSPFAPHLADELWSRLGHLTTVVHEPYPVADATYLSEDRVACVVQVQGKVRGHLDVSADIADSELTALALELPNVQIAIGDRPIRNVIVRAPRLANIVLG